MAPLPITTVSKGTSANMTTLFSQPSNSPRVPSNRARTMNTGPMISSAAKARRQTTRTPTVPSSMISAPIERMFAGDEKPVAAAMAAGLGGAPAAFAASAAAVGWALVAASLIALKKTSSCCAKRTVAEPLLPTSTLAISSGAPVARFHTTDW